MNRRVTRWTQNSIPGKVLSAFVGTQFLISSKPLQVLFYVEPILGFEDNNVPQKFYASYISWGTCVAHVQLKPHKQYKHDPPSDKTIGKI